jgi:phospholipase C
MKEGAALLGMLAAIVGSVGEVRSEGIKDITTIVVIHAENRSFDSLYGSFPGRQRAFAGNPGRLHAARSGRRRAQGTPPAWGGLTAKGVVPAVTQTQTEHLPNAPFAIDEPTSLTWRVWGWRTDQSNRRRSAAAGHLLQAASQSVPTNTSVIPMHYPATRTSPM